MIDNNNNILSQENCSTYNLAGMVYRIRMKPGVYKMEVIPTLGKNNNGTSICGMKVTKIINSIHLDDAGLIAIKHYAKWNENTWIYEYVSGQNYIDIEIEPLHANIPIGIKDIKITAIENQLQSGHNDERTGHDIGTADGERA